MAEYDNSIPSSRGYPISDLINVKEFLAKWDNDVFQLCAEESTNREEEIAKRMKIGEDIIKELEAVCSLDHMKADDDISETEKWKLLEVIPDNTELMALRFQKFELEKRKNDRLYQQNIIRKMKYKKDESIAMNSLTKDEAEIPEEYRVIYPDVVIEVNVHRPLKIREVMLKDANLKSQVLVQSGTIQVLGRQKLTDLRDVVRCVYDLTISGDLSENPDTENHVYAKDLFKSGFFFIEGVFYNDMRESDSQDYSEPIMKWCRENEVGSYEAKRMEDFTFLDLSVKLGKPYLYMHQGDCEHVIIFSDIRLLERTDIQDAREYPYLQRKNRKHRTMCRGCCAQAARWVTYESPFAPENPFFFCDVCFKALHYDADNKKIGNFSAYKYFDHHAIM